MASGNGTVWKVVVGVTVSLAIAAITACVRFGVFQGEIRKDVAHNHEEIGNNKADCDLMETKVDEHEKYIDGDKVDTVYIKRDIADIKDMQRQILEEVRK